MPVQVAGFTISPQQKWQWLSPQRRQGLLACAILLEGDLDRGTLERALQHVIDRNEILRTTFVPAEESQFPLQIVNGDTHLSKDGSDLSHLSLEEQEQRIDEILSQESSRRWDSEEGSWRSMLLSLSSQRHVLIISLPAMCADAATFASLLVELSRAYGLGEQAESLADKEFQYIDCAEWQNQLLKDEAAAAGRDFWRKQEVSGVLHLRLPFAAQTNARDRVSPEIFSVQVDSRTLQAIRSLLLKYNVMLPDFILATWRTLLWRVTGQSSIVVAQMFDGRRSEILQDVLGPFAKWIPIRNSFIKGMKFEEVLRNVRQATSDAADWQEYFVGSAESNVAADLESPLAFSFERWPEKQVAGSLTSSLFKIRSSADQFELKCSSIETTNALTIEFHYNPSLYRGDYIGCLAEQFEMMLADAAVHPESNIGDLSVLSPREQNRLLIELNQTNIRKLGDKCFHTIFEEQVERTPGHTAVVFEKERLSYAELNARANQLAHCLRSIGVAPEERVGIHMARSADMLVALLGIVKAGGAYLPLDIRYPTERLSFMLQDAGVRFVITQQRVASRLPDHTSEAICLDTDQRILSHSRENPAASTSADNLVYVLYTSGSTGRPKGVMIPHRGLTNYLDWCLSSYVSTGGHGSLVHSPLGFDLTITSLLTSLLIGQTVTLVPEEGGALALASALRGRGSSFDLVKLTPAHLEVLNQELSGEELRNARTLIIGGEALRGKALTPWIAQNSDIRLINEYGPTETVVGCCTYEVRPGDDAEDAVPIGRPITNTQIYILDEYLRVLPVGITGELYVGGQGVARGYLQHPALTAEKFIPHPFSEVPGARLYRTGDLARFRPDGNIEFLGRNDHQVKVHGYRIELGEIEAVLREHKAVREAVVSLREAGLIGQNLAAFVVAQPSTTLTPEVLKEHLAARVPEHAIPSAFVMLDRLPLTANGKVDRQNLPAPGREVRTSKAAYVAPRTSIEKTLAEIWATALNVERVGVNDNFFALGGDSIRSVRVVALAKEKGIIFSIQEIFQHQTLGRLASHVRTARAPAIQFVRTQPFSLISEADRLKLPADVEDAYPLAMLQAGMLYHMKLAPESATYHNVSAWHLRFPFQYHSFKAAVKNVFSMQENLRTSFDLTNYSEPLQLVHKNVQIPLQVEDWRQLKSDDQREAAREFLKRQNTKFFDITTPPLVRIFIHRFTDDSCLFTFIEPHSISDGWSTTSTLAEIFERYFALLDNQAPPALLPPAISYRDFVHIERAAMKAPEFENYWRQKLDGAVPVQLPRWPGATGPDKGHRLGKQDTFIDDELLKSLIDLAASAGVPLKTVLLAAHMKAISFASGQTDVISGLVSNGRPEEMDGERLRGLFLNTLPFRLKLSGGSWRDLLRETYEAETEMLPFRWYPMAALQKSLNEQALFEVAFTYLNFHSVERLLRSGRVEVLESFDLSRTNYTLSVVFILNLGPTPRLELALDYERSLLCDEQVTNYLGYFEKTLRAMVNDPDAHYEREDLLSDQETHRLLVDLNSTGRDFPQELCIHELFEAQAAQTPQRTAVVFGAEQLSYEELNAQANQLANYLRRAGVGPEMLAGIMLERSVSLVVAILGVLKAGGAYVPLDPQYPSQRLRYMVEDAGISVLVTDREWEEKLEPDGVQVISIDREAKEIARESEANISGGAAAENLAYVIYTSGSTGKPKGAMVSHSNVLRLLKATESWFHFTDQDVWTLFHSYAFDFSVWEIWGALLYGGRLVVVPHLVSRTPELFYDLLKKEKVTVLNQTPSAFRGLVSVDEKQEAAGELALRWVIFGGEALDIVSVRRWFERHGDECPTLVNMYGITETTVHVTYCPLSAHGNNNESGGAIGCRIPDLQVYVLDQYLQPVPIGVAGQMYVGGAGVSRGYLNQPKLTAGCFLPDPFSRQGGARLYRTGDLARYLPDGQIEFLGRVDDQVKIRGFRIELGEVEVALSQHENVSEAVVVARQAPGNSHMQLVAYVVPRTESGVTSGTLRRHLEQQLPDHMIPAAFVLMPQLPRTPSGKLDRRGLPAPALNQTSSEISFVAPQTEMESILAAVWQEVLNTDKAGINDSFFDLGGDSLLLLRANAKLKEALNRDISIVEMFEYPTISSLAAYLSEQERENALTRGRSRAETRRQFSQQQKQHLARAVGESGEHSRVI